MEKNELEEEATKFKDQVISRDRPAKLIELHLSFSGNCLMGIRFYDCENFLIFKVG